MKIIFLGSAPIATLTLQAILDAGNDEVVAIVSQPDRPQGRKRKLGPCPLRAYATEHAPGIPQLCPEKIGSEESVTALEALEPAVMVVVAYGQYIPPRVLAIPAKGSINLHPSLLPKYRGASPVQSAIANGDTISGSTILYVQEEMDAGDIILQRELPIDPTDTSPALFDKLGALGAGLMAEALNLIRTDTVVRQPQDDALATYVGKLTKEDGLIDWFQPASEILNRIRAYQPWPGCTTHLPNGQSLRIWTAILEKASGTPGTILETKGSGPLVACGQDALRLLEVQPEGKARMTGPAAINGRYLKPSMLL